MARRFTTLASVATAAMLATTMGTASAQTTTACGTAPAGYNIIESNARFIVGTTGNDFICAGDGNNVIRAKGKDDIIFGNGGNDVIWAGFGNDTVYGGEGNDIIRAGGGKDKVFAEGGNDRVLAGSGPDIVRGGDGDDTITGGDGHDTLRGDAGNDKLIGNKGIDRLNGDAGRDTLQGGIGPDTLNGGADNDVVTGGDQDDVLTGGNGNDRLLGGNGEDTLIGGAGDDILAGGGNPDILRGGDGNDTIDGGNGLNAAQGGNGVDMCRNTDDPVSSCEFIDGYELAALPARITFNVALDQSVVVRGDDWTPSRVIDYYLPVAGSNVDGPVTIVNSNASGDFNVALTAAQVDGRAVKIVDRGAGRIKTYTPVVNSISYVDATKTLTINGVSMQTPEAFVYDVAGNLIFVEQMTLNGGSLTVDFLEVTVPIGRMDIVHSDADGDRAVYTVFAAA